MKSKKFLLPFSLCILFTLLFFSYPNDYAIAKSKPVLKIWKDEGAKILILEKVKDQQLISSILSFAGLNISSQAIGMVAKAMGVPLSSCEVALVRHKNFQKLKGNPGVIAVVRRGDIWQGTGIDGIITIVAFSKGFGVCVAKTDNNLKPISEKVYNFSASGEIKFVFAVIVLDGLGSMKFPGGSTSNTKIKQKVSSEKNIKLPSKKSKGEVKTIFPKPQVKVVQKSNDKSNSKKSNSRVPVAVGEGELTFTYKMYSPGTGGQSFWKQLERNTRYYIWVEHKPGKMNYSIYDPNEKHIATAVGGKVPITGHFDDGEPILTFKENQLYHSGGPSGMEFSTKQSGKYWFFFGFHKMGSDTITVSVYKYPDRLQKK